MVGSSEQRGEKIEQVINIVEGMRKGRKAIRGQTPKVNANITPYIVYMLLKMKHK
ncbi:hypothetical protein SAMN05216352_104214 [Alteribacillus bidgolensis]|uniref:Uncharacterized protein n=1 Tax=Alteribacillus bidgolensis TaxID=930129 RepID=A0A1G8HDI6_9BACI|nr:hypothetical protein SAMN05216352_104214 [Alteribacillus bidgolensis]